MNFLHMANTPHLIQGLVIALYVVTFGGFIGMAIASGLMMAPLLRLGKSGWGTVWKALPKWHRGLYVGSCAAFFGGFVALTVINFLLPVPAA